MSTRGNFATTMKRSKEEMGRLKEWARLLYTKEKRTQKDIAETVGVTAKTIGEWKEDGKWDELKQTLTRSKEERLRDLYEQLDEFNKFIKNKPEGLKFPDSKQSDALRKLTTSIRDLEVELNVSTIIDTMMDFIHWYRNIDFKKAQEVAEITDGYIKSKLT